MRLLPLLAALVLGFANPPVEARQAVERGDYIIHYSAFTADFLHPPVAQGYGIQRSRNRAVLTIAIQRKPGTAPANVAARVSASALDKHQRLRQFELREVKEGEAVYYLADFPVENEEVLDFDIQVKPAGQSQIYTFGFRQQFFTEDR